MASNQNAMNDLAAYGLTESVVADVLRDKKGGIEALNRLKTDIDNQKKQAQDAKVTECSNLFPTLSQAFIRSVLSENKWDVEASVGPLVEAANALQRKNEERNKIEEDAKRVGSAPQPTPVPAPVKPRSAVSIAAPTQVELGDSITIRWVVQEGVPQSSDWIAICPLDAQHSQYTSYAWINPAQNSGTLVLTAPMVCGTYQCRYLTKHYDLQGCSAPLRVGPQFELKATIAGTRIVCTWKQAFGADHSRAWAGLYEVGSPEKSYLEMLWTAGRQGEVSFAKPLKAGNYEVRLFSGAYTEAARSTPVVIQQVDTVEAKLSADFTKLEVEGQINSSADVRYCWIGLYEFGAEDKSYIQSQYLPSAKYKLQFSVPSKRGKYEVRLFAGAGMMRAYETRLASYCFPV